LGRHLEDFSDDTAKFWEPRMRRSVSREDARQIAENMRGFFRILLAWDAADQPDQGQGTQCKMIEESPERSGSSKVADE
jgi:G:T-mismatch repair DNA endonuclease (very short patch repair protein)